MSETRARCGEPVRYQFELWNDTEGWVPGGAYPLCMARQLQAGMQEEAPNMPFRFRNVLTGRVVELEDAEEVE